MYVCMYVCMLYIAGTKGCLKFKRVDMLRRSGEDKSVF